MEAKSWIVAAVIFYLCCTVSSRSKSDKIVSLPGQPGVDFHQYSGYISVDEQQERALFYYFVEAESHPETKPLVLWLTGSISFGFACSSVGDGAFVEHGPFKPRANVLVKNEYSWNKEANMLYLESPAGVGFSYSKNKSFYASVTDETTARDNLVFLLRWLNKFPQYKNTDFFIAGASYGGHYVPQLANLILKSKKKINLKGIAIGNPLLEYNTDFNARAEFFWSHGLISDATRYQLTRVCNYSEIRRQSVNGNLTSVCSQVLNLVLNEIGQFEDVFDVMLDICSATSPSQSATLEKLHQGAEQIDLCADEKTDKYLNRTDVQKALHAKLVGVTYWSTCNPVLLYDMRDLEIPTIDLVGSLVKSGIRVLVYSGDQDSIIPVIGTRMLVNGLAEELKLNTTVPYSAWLLGGQVGGWMQVYGDFLTFATIKGAGHKAPFSQPRRSLALFSAFVGGKPLQKSVGVRNRLVNRPFSLIRI